MSVAVPLWKKLHLRYWLEALKAKYQRQGKPYGRLEFDKFLGNFDVQLSPTGSTTLPKADYLTVRFSQIFRAFCSLTSYLMHIPLPRSSLQTGM